MGRWGGARRGGRGAGWAQGLQSLRSRTWTEDAAGTAGAQGTLAERGRQTCARGHSWGRTGAEGQGREDQGEN